MLQKLRPAIGHHLDASSTFRKCDYLDLVHMSPARRYGSQYCPLHRVSFSGPTPSNSSRSGEDVLFIDDDLESRFCILFTRLCDSVDKYELRMLEQLRQEALELEWKKVAYVLDRLLFWVFLISTVISTTVILSSSPYGPTFT